MESQKTELNIPCTDELLARATVFIHRVEADTYKCEYDGYERWVGSIPKTPQNYRDGVVAAVATRSTRARLLLDMLFSDTCLTAVDIARYVELARDKYVANKHAIEANKNAINEALFLVGDDPLPDSDLRSYASDIHNNYVNNRADSDLNDLEYVQHGAIKVDEAIFDKLQQLFANYGFSKDHIDFLVSNQAIDHAIYMKRWTKYAKLGYKPERIERIIFEEDEAETEKEERRIEEMGIYEASIRENNFSNEDDTWLE